MMKRTQAREITTLAYFYTSASPRAIESEQGIEASWPYVIPMEKSGIAEWTRYHCLLRNSLNTSGSLYLMYNWNVTNVRLMLLFGT